VVPASFQSADLSPRPDRRDYPGHCPQPRRLPMSRPRVIHRAGLKTALDNCFNILDNSGLYPELSTCALPGPYQRLRLPSSSAWCWFWPVLVRGPRPSASKLPAARPSDIATTPPAGAALIRPRGEHAGPCDCWRKRSWNSKLSIAPATRRLGGH
jgi:hypothetical protein